MEPSVLSVPRLFVTVTQRGRIVCRFGADEANNRQALSAVPSANPPKKGCQIEYQTVSGRCDPGVAGLYGSKGNDGQGV
jgi:hypothetical protein